jgi:hypothetical protein
VAQHARRVAEAAKLKNRWEVSRLEEASGSNEKLARQLRLLPAGTALPPPLADVIRRDTNCADDEHCTMLMLPGGQEALFFRDVCLEANEDSGCANYSRYALHDGQWLGRVDQPDQPDPKTEARRGAGYKAGQIEVRTVQAHQVYVGGVPVGDPF